MLGRQGGYPVGVADGAPPRRPARGRAPAGECLSAGLAGFGPADITALIGRPRQANCARRRKASTNSRTELAIEARSRHDPRAPTSCARAHLRPARRANGDPDTHLHRGLVLSMSTDEGYPQTAEVRHALDSSEAELDALRHLVPATSKRPSYRETRAVISAFAAARTASARLLTGQVLTCAAEAQFGLGLVAFRGRDAAVWT